MDYTTRQLSPIPMDDRIMQLALQMKKAGLPWEPEVGCFVWDREEIIAQPSPFPKRIYFILSMKRFLAIFGDLEKMKRHLVWLPTWFQARQIMRRLQIGDVGLDKDQPTTAEDEMAGIYRCILRALEGVDQKSAGNREVVDKDLETAWIRSVMGSDFGDMALLPRPIQQRIEAVYREVARAYLGWRRIQESETEDWLPQETRFDNDLLRDLGHFYSDYQKSIQSLDRVRKAAHLLGAIDPNEDREGFERLIDLILGGEPTQSSQQTIMDRLTADGPIQPTS